MGADPPLHHPLVSRGVQREDGGEPKVRRPDDVPRAALVRAASGQLGPVDLF